MRRPLAAAFCAAFFLACTGEDEPLPDAGTVLDSGAGADASVDPDASVEVDAGSCTDPITIPTTRPPVSVEPPYIHELPEPSGSYSVGTHTIVVTDPARLEPGTPDPTDPRVFVVQLFYPSDGQPGLPAPIMEKEVADNLRMGAPDVPADFQAHVLTRSTFDAPISNAQPSWPVVLYSHGFGGWRTEAQGLLEELASRGYVVASLSHPFSSGSVLLPSGLVEIDVPPARTIAEYEVLVEALDERLPRDFVGDMRSTVDAMERWNQDRCSWLAGRFDLTKIAAVGFSFGGAASFRWCGTDARCDAALDTDGQVFIDDLATEIAMANKPWMMMLAERGDMGWDRMAGVVTDDGYSVRVAGALHGDLSGFRELVEDLLPNLTPAALGYGTIDAERVRLVRTAYVNAFLDRHVRGMDEPLLRVAPSPYAEVFFEHLPRPAQGTTSWFGFAARQRFAQVTPLVGAAVTAVATIASSTTTVDANGRWRLDGLSGGDLQAARIEHADIVPNLLSLEPASYTAFEQPIYLVGRAELNGLATSAATTLDATKGHVIVLAQRGEHDANFGALTGAVVTSQSSTAAFGYIRAQAVDASLSGTSGDGRAILFNVSPGTWRGQVTAPGRVCEALPVGRGSTPGTVRTVVEAGAVSITSVLCN